MPLADGLYRTIASHVDDLRLCSINMEAQFHTAILCLPPALEVQFPGLRCSDQPSHGENPFIIFSRRNQRRWEG